MSRSLSFLSFPSISFHFISFQLQALCHWRMGMARKRFIRLCETKRSRQKFPLLQVVKKASWRSARPQHLLQVSKPGYGQVWPENTHCPLTSIKCRAATLPQWTNWREWMITDGWILGRSFWFMGYFCDEILEAAEHWGPLLRSRGSLETHQ